MNSILPKYISLCVSPVDRDCKMGAVSLRKRMGAGFLLACMIKMRASRNERVGRWEGWCSKTGNVFTIFGSEFNLLLCLIFLNIYTSPPEIRTPPHHEWTHSPLHWGILCEWWGVTGSLRVREVGWPKTWDRGGGRVLRRSPSQRKMVGREVHTPLSAQSPL